MTKKLTRKQKLHIVRLEAANLLSQASSELFDDCDLPEDEKEDLAMFVKTKGLIMVKENEPAYFGSAKEIVDYVCKHF